MGGRRDARRRCTLLRSVREGHLGRSQIQGIKELAERYETPLAQLSDRMAKMHAGDFELFASLVINESCYFL